MIIQESFFVDLYHARIDLGRRDVRMMLLNSDYRPDEAHDSRRSDVLPYEVSGFGYEPGGLPVAARVFWDDQGFNFHVDGTVWPQTSVKAKYAAYYQSRGGDAAEDELIGVVPFDEEIGGDNFELSVTSSSYTLGRPTPVED